MPDPTVAMSRYRHAQFRQALHAQGLDDSASSVWRVHDFDSSLRSVTLGLVEQVELALRGRLDVAAGARFGSRWYVDPRSFRATFDHGAMLRRVRSAPAHAADPAVGSAWRRPEERRGGEQGRSRWLSYS